MFLTVFNKHEFFISRSERIFYSKFLKYLRIIKYRKLEKLFRQIQASISSSIRFRLFKGFINLFIYVFNLISFSLLQRLMILSVSIYMFLTSFVYYHRVDFWIYLTLPLNFVRFIDEKFFLQLYLPYRALYILMIIINHRYDLIFILQFILRFCVLLLHGCLVNHIMLFDFVLLRLILVDRQLFMVIIF